MQLRDVCLAIIDCEHKTAPVQAAGYPSIRTPNIGPGYFILGTVNRVSEETYREWTKRAVPESGDLIMAREAPVGNVAMVTPDLRPCLGQRTLLIRPNPSLVNDRYLTYLLIGPEVQDRIHSLTNGATVPDLNLKDGRDLQLPPLPPIEKQPLVASILSAYDDLIANCERRIRVLDEMARALYREWFVNFRYSGHEKVAMVESSIGPVPEGWRVVSAAESLAINPSMHLPREGDRPFVPMASLSNATMVISEIESRSASSGAKFQNGDALFARITPCLENGKTAFVQFLPNASSAACGSTEFIVLRGRTVPPEFVYCLARSEEFRSHAIKSMSGATDDSGSRRARLRATSTPYRLGRCSNGSCRLRALVFG